MPHRSLNQNHNWLDFKWRYWLDFKWRLILIESVACVFSLTTDQQSGLWCSCFWVSTCWMLLDPSLNGNAQISSIFQSFPISSPKKKTQEVTIRPLTQVANCRHTVDILSTNLGDQTTKATRALELDGGWHCAIHLCRHRYVPRFQGRKPKALCLRDVPRMLATSYQLSTVNKCKCANMVIRCLYIYIYVWINYNIDR